MCMYIDDHLEDTRQKEAVQPSSSSVPLSFQEEIAKSDSKIEQIFQITATSPLR